MYRPISLRLALLGPLSASLLACGGGGGGNGSSTDSGTGTDSATGSGTEPTTGATDSGSATTGTTMSSASATGTGATTGTGTTTTATTTDSGTSGTSGTSSGSTGSGDTGTTSNGSTGGVDCVDVDNDGYGTGTQCLGTDCDDGDIDNWVSCASCVDVDMDGFYVGCDQNLDKPFDCDDGNDQITMDVNAVELCNGINDNCNPLVDTDELALSNDICPIAGCDSPPCHIQDMGTACDMPKLPAAECIINDCELDWYDSDNDYATGCECDDTTGNNVCGDFVPVPDTGQFVYQQAAVTKVGRVPDATAFDYYQVSFQAPTRNQSQKMNGTYRIYIADANGDPLGTVTNDLSTNPHRIKVYTGANCTPGQNTVPTGGTGAAVGCDVSTGGTLWSWRDHCTFQNNVGQTTGNTVCGGASGPSVGAMYPTAVPTTVWVEVYRTSGEACDNYTLKVDWL